MPPLPVVEDLEVLEDGVGELQAGSPAPVMPGHGTAVTRHAWRPTVPISLVRARRARLALADSPRAPSFRSAAPQRRAPGHTIRGKRPFVNSRIGVALNATSASSTCMSGRPRRHHVVSRRCDLPTCAGSSSPHSTCALAPLRRRGPSAFRAIIWALAASCRVSGAPWLLVATVPGMTVDIRAAANMGTACRLTRELVVKNPVKPDLSPDYLAVQGWPLVTALYNGIEQALKMLLLVPPNPRFTLETLAKRKYGHNLENLYAELAADDRDHIERHFQEHRSLHDDSFPGLNIATAEQFIAHVNSGGRQGGMVEWRYILIQDISQIPSTSLWTMSELWHGICCIIRTEVFDKQDDCFRLSARLYWDFTRRVRGPEPYDGFIDDFNAWACHKDRSPLAAWIDLLVKAHSGTMHEVRAPARLRTVLAEMANGALAQMTSDSADPDQIQLHRRLQTDPNLAWDPSGGVFR